MPLAAQILLLWLGWWLAAEKKALNLLAGGLLGGTALVGFYALLQRWNLDPLPPLGYFDDRILSVFVNPNHLGNFVACGLPLALAFFFYRSTASATSYTAVALCYAAPFCCRQSRRLGGRSGRHSGGGNRYYLCYARQYNLPATSKPALPGASC